jgi:hypothetical protein
MARRRIRRAAGLHAQAEASLERPPGEAAWRSRLRRFRGPGPSRQSRKGQSGAVLRRGVPRAPSPWAREPNWAPPQMLDGDGPKDCRRLKLPLGGLQAKPESRAYRPGPAGEAGRAFPPFARRPLSGFPAGHGRRLGPPRPLLGLQTLEGGLAVWLSMAARRISMSSSRAGVFHSGADRPRGGAKELLPVFAGLPARIGGERLKMETAAPKGAVSIRFHQRKGRGLWARPRQDRQLKEPSCPREKWAILIASGKFSGSPMAITPPIL